MKSATITEKVTLAIILVISLSLTAMDLIGALDSIPWLQQRVPVLTLLVVGVVTLAVFTDPDRNERVMAKSLDARHRDLVRTLGSDDGSKSTISRLNGRFDERAKVATTLLDVLATARTKTSLAEKYRNLLEGAQRGRYPIGARAQFPYDLVIGVMDTTGRLIHNPRPKMVGTRPNLPHHPTMLNERSGRTTWINQFRSPAFEAFVGEIPSALKNDRLTEVHFRYNPTLKYICYVEAHLNVIYQLPLPATERRKFVGACLVRGDRVLLLLRSSYDPWFGGRWDLVGGHVSSGETTQAAIVREIREEIGVTVAIEDKSAPHHVLHSEDADTEIWVVRTWQGRPRNVEPDEHQRIEWFDIQQIRTLELAHAEHRSLIEKILTQSK